MCLAQLEWTMLDPVKRPAGLGSRSRRRLSATCHLLTKLVYRVTTCSTPGTPRSSTPP
ncbi:MAG: hypothetical protein ACTSU5_13615 [Promethearchaeota archaeon]